MKQLAPILVAALAISCGGLIAGCAQTPTTPTSPVAAPLTPARSIVGTWRTRTPVTFTYQTDFCGGRGGPVAQAQWNVTWIITAVAGFTNVVDIEMRFTRGGSTPTVGGCGGDSGWVPLVSPTFIRAALSGTRIGRSTTDTNKGLSIDGTFDTSQMKVTWIHWECLIYCFGEYTADRGLELFNQ